jgi:hypothetical protein
MASENNLPVLTERKGKIRVFAFMRRTRRPVNVAGFCNGVAATFKPGDRFVNR